MEHPTNSPAVSRRRPVRSGTGFPRATARFEANEIGADLVLNDPATGAVHVLNETAAVVWWLCDGQRSCDDVVVRVAKLYRRDLADIEDDIRGMLSELIDIKAITEG